MEPTIPTRTRTTPLPVQQDAASTSRLTFFSRVQNDRALAFRLLAAIVVLVLVGAAIAITYTVRANAASAQLADAMQVLDTPVSTPDQGKPTAVLPRGCAGRGFGECCPW